MPRVSEAQLPSPEGSRKPGPKVSVVVPTYNRAKLLARAMRSVLAQTYEDFELIVVDDHGADQTPAVIAGFDDPRLRSLRHAHNGGQSMAFNTGIEQARGSYVAFLDDDDEWHPDKLAAQVALLDAAPAAIGMVYAWREIVDDAAGTNRFVKRTLRGNIYEHMLALDTPVPPSSWLLRTAVAKSLRFEEELRVAKDLDFVTRFCEAGWEVDFVPAVLVRKHMHADGQLSDRSPANLAGRMAQFRLHMRRFDRDLRARPKALATVHRRLINCACSAGDRGSAASSLVAAMGLDPLGTVLWLWPRGWLRMAGVFLGVADAATRRARRRDDAESRK